MPDFNINPNAIIIILLGIIACLFPVFSPMTSGMISGFAFFMIAISLLLFGLSIIGVNQIVGIVDIVLAFVAIFFSLSLIFNPQFVSSFVSFITYFVGLLMIISGLFYAYIGQDYFYFTYLGISTVILGILYIIFGIFTGNPIHLGIIVGIWLIISGIFDCFKPKTH